MRRPLLADGSGIAVDDVDGDTVATCNAMASRVMHLATSYWTGAVQCRASGAPVSRCTVHSDCGFAPSER
jgi:hypothetical protein